MNPWVVVGLVWAGASVIWAPIAGRWLRRSREAAEEEAPTCNKPPARETANPVPPAPGPPWDELPARHGGLVATLDVFADGRVVTHDHRTGELRVGPGHCADCGQAISDAIDNLLRGIL